MQDKEAVEMMRAMDAGIMQVIDRITAPYDAKEDEDEELTPQLYAVVLSVLSRITASSASSAGMSEQDFVERMAHTFRTVKALEAMHALVNKARTQ
jgi:hypothetical protein